MCGIIGGSNPKWDYTGAVQQMLHRGPDAQKIQRIKEMVFGFARLSIVDLNEIAMQPMVSADGRFVIVFNGEIYDYLSLRTELEKKGYCFKSQSDTEVLLYAFVEWREKLCEHLDGIFAFAIYDTLEEKVYLFRDRCGIKPLYYYYDGHEFAFASELDTLKTLCTDVAFEIDMTALYDYHTYLYIPEPKTMYQKVYKLPSASYLIFNVADKRLTKPQRYWKVHLNTKAGEPVNRKKLDEKAEELRYHFENVIRRQVIADVPVGTFLSGGVDSSIVTALVKKYVKDLTAYTIGFKDKRYDESVYAREVADILQVNCESKYFEISDFERSYKILPELYGEPYADTSAYPTYFVSKFARENVTVVLTGDGGDELFGGYPRCTLARDILDKKRCSNRWLSQLYLRNRDFLQAMGTDLGIACREDIAVLSEWYQYSKKPNITELRKKYGIDKDYDDFWYYRKYYHKDLPPFTRLRYLDFMTYMNGDILTKVDRASMKVSLEARVPFLDKEMIDFAFSLTQEECNPKGELKGLLKYAYENVIPRRILDRKKQGFSIPFSYIRRGSCPQEYLIESLWKL